MTRRTLTRTTAHHAANGSPPLRAVIYTRISADKEGKELGVTRQHEDALALIGQRHYVIATTATGSEAGEYRDNDRGASTRSRKTRPAFAAMLAAVKGGEADVIVAYSASRLTRRPAEWETIIQLVESTGVQIQTVASGDANFSTADGRAVARTIAAWDAAEAERTAERVSRAHQQRQESGRPNWPNRPFGLNRDGTLNETEAEAIRDGYRRIMRGAALAEIARRWNAAGILTTTGAQWQIDTLSRMLRHPRTAGLMDATGTPGIWAAILTRTEWDALRATSEGRSAKWERAGRMANLLSGIAVCYACDTPAVVAWRGGKAAGDRRYICPKGHATVPAGPADDAAVRAVTAMQQTGAGMLSGRSATHNALSGPGAHTDTRELEATVAKLTGRLARHEAEYAAEDDPDEAAMIRGAAKRVRGELAEARRKLAEAEAARATAVSLDTLVAEWGALDLSTQRDTLRKLPLRITLRPYAEGEPDERIMIDWIE